jgi:hypothetical protein
MDQVKQLSMQVAALELHVADLRTALFLLMAGRDVAPLCATVPIPSFAMPERGSPLRASTFFFTTTGSQEANKSRKVCGRL